MRGWPVAVLDWGVVRDEARLENSDLVALASARAFSATGPFCSVWTVWELEMEDMAFWAAFWAPGAMLESAEQRVGER